MVEWNPALTGFNLSSLETAWWVAIDNNGALVSLPALPRLAAGVSVDIYYNNALANLNGLAGVTQLYRLLVGGSPASRTSRPERAPGGLEINFGATTP